MDRDIAPEVRRRRIARIAITVVIAIATIVFFLAATVQWLRPSVKRRDIQTARVERGSVDATLQASGTVMPALEQVISSPVEARVLRILRQAGDRVKAGDELVALDTSATRLDVDKLNSQLQQKESELAQLKLKIEDSAASLKASIAQKELDGQILQFKAEQTRKLHEAGLAAAQEDLAAATAAKKAQIELTQLREQLVRQERIDRAQLMASTAALHSVSKDREESQRQLQLAMMRADRDGVITWMTTDAGAVVRKGDAVARIADLSAFRVDATISDIHAAKLAPGMPVRVRAGDADVRGAITSIEPRIEGGVLKFHVALDRASMPKLRNNVRVDVFVITGRRDGVLRVRRGSLGQGDREEIYVVRDGQLVRTPVRWGLAGDDFIEPLSGLNEGDEVVVSNMSDYDGVKRLRIR